MKFFEVFGCWHSLTVGFKLLPGDYLKAVGFPGNTSGTPEAALAVQGWAGCSEGACGLWRAPMPQPQAAALPLSLGVLREVFGILEVILFSFWLPCHFKQGSCCREDLPQCVPVVNPYLQTGVFCRAGTGWCRRGRVGCALRAAWSLCSRGHQTHFCCRQKSSLCCRSDPPTRREKSTEASSSLAKEGT